MDALHGAFTNLFLALCVIDNRCYCTGAVFRVTLAIADIGSRNRWLGMLLKNWVLKGIEAGRITLAFRRWTRPTVRTNGTLRTPIGILAIEQVETIEIAKISEEDARQAGFEGREALLVDLGKQLGGTLYRIKFHLSGPDPRTAVRQNDHLDAEEFARLHHRLAALDTNSRSGPWATKVLQLIGERDGRTAGEIADCLGIPKPTLKRKIRQLKELGLTESLQSGYRLSDRGRVVHTLLRGPRS